MAFYNTPIQPLDPVIIYDRPSGTIRYIRDSFHGTGMVSYPAPPAAPQQHWQLLQNVMPITQGELFRRWGYASFATPTIPSFRMYEYENESTSPPVKKVVSLDGLGNAYALNENGTTYNNIGGIDGCTYAVNSRSYMYFFGGVGAVKWNGAASGGTSFTGFFAPSNALSINTSGAGAVTLVSGRKYYYIYRNSTTGHMSDLSLVSPSTGAITNKDIVLTGFQPSLDSQVDKIWILATADGGDQTLLYFLAEVSVNATTYTDNTPDITLVQNNVVQQTDVNGNLIGVVGNEPPPATTMIPIKHQGRLFTVSSQPGSGLVKGNILFCSKNLAELTTSTGLVTGKYEESWPPVNAFDISDNAETVTALASDGVTLYICTARHIYRMTGDSPINFQFQQVVFNEAGVLSQDAMDIIYIQGSPSGAVWMTPDLRIIHSDFNTYVDIGNPVQDVLNTVNLSHLTSVRVAFVSSNAFDLVLVGFNTTNVNGYIDTILVFDCRTQLWYKWILNDPLITILFKITTAGVVQWLLSTGTSNTIMNMTVASTTDNGTGITAQAVTQWMHLGMPVERKWLNEIELMTSDPGVAVNIDAADTVAQFATPNSVVANFNPVVSTFGTYKVFLAGYSAHHRYFRLTFSSGATAGPFLATYNLEAIPIHKI